MKSIRLNFNEIAQKRGTNLHESDCCLGVKNRSKKKSFGKI